MQIVFAVPIDNREVDLIQSNHIKCASSAISEIVYGGDFVAEWENLKPAPNYYDFVMEACNREYEYEKY